MVNNLFILNLQLIINIKKFKIIFGKEYIKMFKILLMNVQVVD